MRLELITIVLALALPAFEASSPPDVAAALTRGLQPLLDQQAQQTDAGVVLAFRGADGTTLEMAAGKVRRGVSGYGTPVRPVKSSDPMMWGSITKMYTAAGVLRLVERGVVGLDDYAAQHVDQVLSAQIGENMTSLFGAEAAQITVPHATSASQWASAR